MFGLSLQLRGLRRAALELRFLQNRIRASQVKYVRTAAFQAKKKIIKNLQSRGTASGRHAPLSPLTILIKKYTGKSGYNTRGSLQSTGSLKKAIRVVFAPDQLSAFVGVTSDSYNDYGESLDMIARVHEFGTGPYQIPVTQEMRNFFWWLNMVSNGEIRPIDDDKTVINHPGIPARPFLRPALQQVQNETPGMITRIMRTV